MATLKLNVVIGATAPTLSISISDAVDIAPEIFIFEQLVEKESDGSFKTSFYSVANVAQMTELPNEVSIGNPFFRKLSADFTFTDYSSLNIFLENLKGTVNLTVNSWNDSLLFTVKTFSVDFPY